MSTAEWQEFSRTVRADMIALVALKIILVGGMLFLLNRYAEISGGIKVLFNILILVSMAVWMLGLFWAWHLAAVANTGR